MPCHYPGHYAARSRPPAGRNTDVALQLVVVASDGLLTREHPGGDWEPVVEGLDALARLTHAGYHVVITSALRGKGPPDGQLQRQAAQQTALQRLASAAGGVIDAFFLCPHPLRQVCDCRPPRPGLYQQIAARWRIDLQQVACCAATSSDLTAAAVAGGRPIAIGDFPNHELSNKAGAPWPLSAVHPHLGDFVDALLNERNSA